MITKRLRLQTSQWDEVLAYFRHGMHPHFTTESEDLCVLMTEVYYRHTRSTQMNMMVFKRQEGGIVIDVLGGGG